MIWLTWRQFRAQAIMIGCVLAAFAIALLATGPGLAHLYTATGLPGCRSHGDCAQLASQFLRYHIRATGYAALFYLGLGLTYLAPALIGAFWGAPLVAREIETGTFRLAWNQSVSRRRWALAKLGLIGAAAMATAGLLSLMVTWWAEPLYRAVDQVSSPVDGNVSQFVPLLFGAHGIVPVGYAAFGFALGVTAGVLIKRTIPAMAVTLAGFVAVQFAWLSWIRPHLLTPLRVSIPLTPSAITGIGIGTGSNSQMSVSGAVTKPGAWILGNQTVNSAGHPFTGPATQACLSGSQTACDTSIGALHLKLLISYQPASRFWEFQWYETAIFLLLAVALAWSSSLWINRRRLA
jgi:hypothetical protein